MELVSNNLELDKSFFLANTKESYDFFKKIVNMNSFTHDFVAVNTLQGFIKKNFEQLGCRVVEHLNHEKLPLLEINYGNSSIEPISLICHSDCAQKSDECSQFKIDENSITGAGVIDNKAGIHMAYKLIKSLVLKDIEDGVSIRVLVYPSEERGSIGFEKLSRHFGEKGKYFFGLEPADTDGALIQCRGGNRWYEFNFESKPLHSGRIKSNQFSLGNYVMSEISNVLRELNQREGLKLNLTSIESSDKTFNTTIQSISLRLDLRFLNNEDRDKAHKILVYDTFKFINFEYEIFDDCPAMSYNENSKELIQKYFNYLNPSMQNTGLTSYGAADLNYLANEDNICVDGFGALGKDMHAKNEYLDIKALEGRSSALEKIILELFNVHS